MLEEYAKISGNVKMLEEYKKWLKEYKEERNRKNEQCGSNGQK